MHIHEIYINQFLSPLIYNFFQPKVSGSQYALSGAFSLLHVFLKSNFSNILSSPFTLTKYLFNIYYESSTILSIDFMFIC